MSFEAFLRMFEEHYKGVLMLLLVILTIVFIINWLASIFMWGRYKKENYRNIQTNLAQIIAKFFANIITDFRHLLALLVVIVFVSIVFYAMASTGNFEEKMEALQLVTASLSGLLGSIIGYYFGESAVRRSQTSSVQATSEGNAPETEQDVAPVPTPKGLEL